MPLKYIEQKVNTKFLGLQIHNHLNWKSHTEQIIPKLSGACYAIRLMGHISNISTLKAAYYAYLHSVIKFGIIIWGISSNSGKIFILQKKIIRVIAVAQPEFHVEVYSNSSRFYLFLANMYFHK
jgi:hypothetical protein